MAKSGGATDVGGWEMGNLFVLFILIRKDMIRMFLLLIYET